jgi:DNA-binding FrmR family transcriptional regulator
MLQHPPRGDITKQMTKHTSHPAIITRLKRAHGHLKSIIDMLEEDRSCLEIAQQLQAVEKAVTNAKKVLVHDHIDHCLEHAVKNGASNVDDTVREFKDITKYL